MEEVREAFRLFDTEGRGTIEIRELKAAMRALGFQVKKTEIREMLLDIDKDENSLINLDVFTELLDSRFVFWELGRSKYSLYSSYYSPRLS